MQRATVAAVKVTRRSEELGADVRRCVGYRAACPDGFTGSLRRTWLDARMDALEHNREAHEPVSARSVTNSETEGS